MTALEALKKMRADLRDVDQGVRIAEGGHLLPRHARILLEEIMGLQEEAHNLQERLEQSLKPYEGWREEQDIPRFGMGDPLDV